MGYTQGVTRRSRVTPRVSHTPLASDESYVACTTVDCLPPITGREKLYPWVTHFGFRQLRDTHRLDKVWVFVLYTLHYFEASDMVEGMHTVVHSKENMYLKGIIYRNIIFL